MNRFHPFLLAFAVCLIAPSIHAAELLADVPYAQNFDSMGTSGTTTPDGWTILGNTGDTGSTWTGSIPASGISGGTANTSLTATTSFSGSSLTSGYNYALSGSTSDRALGVSPTSSKGAYIQLTLTNSTGEALSAFYISYDIRRFTASSSVNELPGYWLFYSLNGGTTWTNVSALNPTVSGPAGVVVSNTTGVTSVPSTEVLLSGSWNTGSTLLLRWVDDNSSNVTPDQIYGLDNIILNTSDTPNRVELASGVPYSQDFDSMGTAGTAPPLGWTIIGTTGGTGSDWSTNIPANEISGGTPNSSVTATTSYSGLSAVFGYNYALSGTPNDRALGTSPTSSKGTYIQLTVTNVSGTAVSLLDISYDIRRFTAASSTNELPGFRLFYSLDGGASWNNIPEFNPTASGPSGVIVPNTTGVTSIPLTEITLVSPWAPESQLLFRWVDDNSVNTAPDQIYGLDNVTLINSHVQQGQAPVVTLTAPTNNDSFSAPATINLEATASDPDGTITKVEFYNSSTKLGEDTDAPYTYTWNSVGGGSYNLSARATDNDSNLVISNVVNTIVDSGSSSGTLTRGPYLQKAASDRITIRWRSSASVRGRVRYGIAFDALNTTVNESSVGTEHEVALSGLTPATTYFYSIGSAADTLAGGDANHTFTTPPVTGTPANTRIWVLGDAGTGFSAQSNVRNAFYTWTGSRTPDLVLQLGDNAYNSGFDNEYQTKVFDIYGTMMRKTPFWSCLGNHETDQNTTFSDSYPYFNIYSFPTAGECGGVPSGTEHYYSFDYGNIHFISLDTMTASRSPTGPMATWLESDLENTTATWIVAFFHHPPYTKGSHNSDGELDLIEVRQNLLPILEAGGVDLVLCGHSHSYERSYLIDGHYGSSGTFTSTMKVNPGDGRPGSGGAYVKPLTGPREHFGAVYAVAGSAGGQGGGGSLNHPAMFYSTNDFGSLVLDVNGDQLNATFIRDNNTFPDSFTLLKQGAADADEDGMADQWEIENNLNRFTAADASLDGDGDGMTNLQEFIAGTDPHLVSSKFTAEASWTSTPGEIAISFTAQVGKTYTVRYKDELPDTTWSVLQQIPASENSTTVTIHDTPPLNSVKRFYQVATPQDP